ncbi:MAG: hypothetical protein J6B26_01105 [Agathobacter sp.]|nr:hypothetical protein [Agathobacter sp.]MBQ2283351.1 hypothetical protein [Agathobacter sp.]
MNKKKLIPLLSAVALVAAIGVGSTLAYFTDNDAANNVVTMGHVNIELDEPEFSAENENNTIKNVVPNQTITKDPTITVVAGSESCYLRAKIEITELNAEQIADLLENTNIGEDWVLAEDGYYYYQNSVSKSNEDQTVDLFDTVVIPAEWGNEVADMTFEINVTAEAIQADNFTPETDEAGVINGWNDITAETYEG